MLALAPLDNETIFKKAFTDNEVFQQFIKDLFDIEVIVDKIETEKKFQPPIANIDIKLDIYAETHDHRFVIEIQKIDYDYNFNRFLNYFVSLLIEQQQKASKYKIPQTVLGVIVLTRPYKIDQLTGEPIKEDVMLIDFDTRNLKDEKIRIFNHKLLFLNPHPKYQNSDTPKNIKDWLDLFRLSIDNNMEITLNLTNKGIAKTVDLIEYEKLDAETITNMKISEQKKAMISIVKNEGKYEEKIDIAKSLIEMNVDIDTIQKSTKLSKKTIARLINEHRNK